jgi:AcrR family transcriptional regulator
MLEAIARTVGDKGYAQTTIQDVLESAGVSSKTFYEQFSDKEDCVVAAYDAVVARVMGVVTKEYLQGSRWPERVKLGLAAFLRFFGYEPGLARMAMVEVLAAGPRARERYAAAVRGFVTFFEDGRADSPHPERLPAHLSEAVVGGITATLYHHVVTGQAEAIPLLLPDLLYCSLVPYLGHASATRAVSSVAMSGPEAANRSVRRQGEEQAVGGR